MKKVIIILTMLLTYYLANAQVFVEPNIIGSFPAGQNQVLNYGVGINLNLGYSVKTKLDLIAKLEKQWFSGIGNKYNLSSISGGLKYYPFNNLFKPYIGLGIGYYQSYIELPDFENQKIRIYEYGLGFSPKIGILFKTNISENLLINTEFSYNKILTNNKINIYCLNLGIRYLF